VPKVILTVEGQTQGWVDNPYQVIAPIQQVEGANLKAAGAIEQAGAAAVPSARSMRLLGMSAFSLTGSMQELGPAAGQVGTGLRLLGMTMNSGIGIYGILIAAVGGLAFAFWDVLKAEEKADEAFMKTGDKLLELAKKSDAFTLAVKQQLEVLAILTKEEIKKTQKTIDHSEKVGIQIGWLKRLEVELLANVAGMDRAQMMTGVANGAWVDWNKTLGQNQILLAKDTKALSEYQAVVAHAEGRLSYPSDQPKKEKEAKGGGGTAKSPEDIYNERMFKNQQEHDRKMNAEAQKSTEEFNRIWEEAGKQEYNEQVKLASQLMSSNVSEHKQKLALIEAERKAYIAVTKDEVTANKLANAAKKKLNDQESADKKKLYSDLKKSTLDFGMATAAAFGMSSKAQIEANIAIAAIEAIMAMGRGFMLLSNPLTSGQAAAAFMAAAQYGSVAMTGAAQLRGTMAVPTPTTETGGGSYAGGGGGTVQSAPSGPMTNYYYFTSTVNGNVIGLDSFTKYLDEWFQQKLRMSGGDIVRSGNR